MFFLKVDLEPLTNGALSTKAVMLYSYLKGLRRLSEQNDIKDKNGKVVVFCAIAKVMDILGISKPTAIKIFKELEAINYIKRVRRGQGKASYIYMNSQEQKFEKVNTALAKQDEEHIEAQESHEEHSDEDNNAVKPEMETFTEIKVTCKKSDTEAGNMLKAERIKTVMKEIIRQKNIDIPPTVVKMIIYKIQLNNYKIYNIYRYVLKCIENYIANPFSISSTAPNSITVRRPIPVINRFTDFEQRHYTDEEMKEITDRWVMKSSESNPSPIPVINRFNNFEQRHYTDEEMDKITKNLLRK